MDTNQGTPDNGEGESRDYRRELEKERRLRETLQRQVEEMATENRRRREESVEAETVSQLRTGLEQRGVRKTGLAIRALREEVRRGDDGSLYGEVDGGRLSLREYLDRFVADNPEFLPPRITGGSGVSGTNARELSSTGFDLESIRPGMSQKESRDAWKEVARLMGSSGPAW